MSDSTQPTLSVSLTVRDAAEALDFYTKALGAVELYRMPDPSGAVAHAEFMIGTSLVYISGEAPEWHANALKEGQVASCLFAISVEDCDKAFERAIQAGMKELNPPSDQFWGARSALILDPFGYRWNFNQFIEEVSPEEMAKRAKEIYG
ncbi:MAG: VOC family protein [Akkermansiaceae bacterium]